MALSSWNSKKRYPPRISGTALRGLRTLAESPVGQMVVADVLKKSLGVSTLLSLPFDYRQESPLDAYPIQAREPARWDEASFPSAPPAAWPRTASAYTGAYAAGTITPTEVTRRALAFLEELPTRKPSMNVLTSIQDPEIPRSAARAASERYRKGVPLSPYDGVPVLVKDEYDMIGLPTRLGSRVESEAPSERDSTIVARLKAGGAVLLGKTVLTEWGMSPIGCNPTQDVPHNAYSPSHAPGGSSTGSAVGVALGLGPAAASSDGGGSIRIPASLNGLFGIKPTFCRSSRYGDPFKGSVAHGGPIGVSSADLAAYLDLTTLTPDENDPLTARALPPQGGSFAAKLGAGVKGLRIGIIEGEWEDASPEVAATCQQALRALEQAGATIHNVRLPLAKHSKAIGYVTIGPEALTSVLEPYLHKRHLISDDLRLAFATISTLSASDALDAMRLRGGLRLQVVEVLRQVDFLALPTTAVTAPRFSESDAKTPFSDPEALDGLSRYAYIGNLTGIPAGTAPVGFDRAGLPIGLQILGDSWDEVGVLAVLAHLERMGTARVTLPPGAIDLLA